MAGPAHYTGTVNIAQNDDWAVAFQYATQNPDGSMGPPIDLTGSEIIMQLRTHESDHIAMCWVDSNGNGIYITDAVNGRFEIVIDRGRLAQMTPGDYVTDIIRILPGGLQERIFEGMATVVEGTSR
jgi:hypothetical protein